MDDIEVLDGIMGVDELEIYCHFTDKDPASILEQGLYSAEEDWHTTLLKLTEEERTNLKAFIEREKSITSALNFRDNAIIVAVPKEDTSTFIENSKNIDMPYIINNDYIAASVDSDTFKTKINESALAWDYVLYR